MIIDSHAHIVMPPMSFRFMAELVGGRSNPSVPPKIADEAVRKSGRTEIYKLTPEERLAFKKVLVHVHKKMESRIGADLIKSIYQATDFDPSKL